MNLIGGGRWRLTVVSSQRVSRSGRVVDACSRPPGGVTGDGAAQEHVLTSPRRDRRGFCREVSGWSRVPRRYRAGSCPTRRGDERVATPVRADFPACSTRAWPSAVPAPKRFERVKLSRHNERRRASLGRPHRRDPARQGLLFWFAVCHGGRNPIQPAGSHSAVIYVLFSSEYKCCGSAAVPTARPPP